MRRRLRESIYMPHLWNRRKPLRRATIAIWGAEKAGKTAFVVAMESAAHREGFAIFTADLQTEQTMQELRKRRSQHQFPPLTGVPASVEDLRPLHFGLKSIRGDLAIDLHVLDTSGRWWIEPDFRRGNGDGTLNPYDAILGKCDGLICLIDPTRALRRAHLPEYGLQASVQTSADVELQTMLAQLRTSTTEGNGLVSAKIAICLTQMDRPEHYGHLDKEDAYFERLFGPLPIHNWVSWNKWKFFGCSSVGVVQRAGYVISNTYKDRDGQEAIIDPNATPIHVFRPLKWILGLV